jgi:hypothetical protein
VKRCKVSNIYSDLRLPFRAHYIALSVALQKGATAKTLKVEFQSDIGHHAAAIVMFIELAAKFSEWLYLCMRSWICAKLIISNVYSRIGTAIQ